LLATAALLAGCDARTPTGSTPAPAGPGAASRPRFEVSAPTALGQANVYNPGSNIAPVPWQASNITIVASDSSPRWIVLRVEGQITDKYNHIECDTLAAHAGASTILCSANALENYGYGPLSNAGSGHVDVALQRGTYAPLASGAVPAPPLAMYPVVADSSVAEALWDVHETVNVWTHRVVNVGGGGSTLGDTYAFPSYVLHGTQTLTVVEVPIPVKVSGPTAATRGDSVTFTAQVTGNYRPRTESGLGQPGPYWYFHWNDTTAAPNSATFFEEMSQCRGATTCRIRAEHQGRMYVKEYLEGRPAENQSEPLKFGVTDPPKLVLRCDGKTEIDSVVRGANLNCGVSAEPSGAAITNIRWEFHDEGSPSHSTSGPDNALSWGGEMAVGGEMHVSAVVDGTSFSDTVKVIVTRRKWPRIDVRVRVGGQGRLPVEVHRVSDLMQTRFDTIPVDSLPFEAITTGPNSGWTYLRSPVRTLPLVVDVNDAWKPGSAWYNLQHPGPTGQTDPNGNGTHYCAHSELPEMYAAGLQHEGVTAGLVSHIEIFKRYFKDNPEQDSLEAAVAYREDPTYDPAAVIASVDVAAVMTRAVADPKQRHTSDVPPGLVELAVFPCQPRF
jgi:hypothetical protein